MGVGDSAEEFISIHALGRERLLVLSCGLPSRPLKNSVFRPLGDDREPVAPVAYQVILEPGIGQFREFESP